MAKRLLQLIFSVLLITPISGLAQPAKATQQAPSTVTVSIRLSADLGDSLPAVQAALTGLPVRIAEPADYELTTKRNYPQTLIAVDAREGKKDWDTDFSESNDPQLVPHTFELGNLVLGDYGGGLQILVDRAVRAKRLLALQARAAAGVESCIGWAQAQDGDTIPTCHFPDEHIADARSEQDLDVFAVRVRNRSASPRYVALLAVEPTLGIQRLELAGGSAPLAPGALAQTGFVELLDSRSERIFVVTISSDRPIDTASLVQAPLEQNSLLSCEEGQGCAAPRAAVDTSDWSVSVADSRVERQAIGEMGGAMSVVEGMAPWMAEYYSTIPYTKAEIAADALKPTQEREFLAERSSSERAHRCGGSLIAPSFVLTAAHCVAKGKYAGPGMARVMAERRVRIGTVYLGDGGTTYAIAGVAVPTTYSPDHQNDDIALLLIQPDRDTSADKAPTIPVGSRPLSGGASLTGFGWGYTGEVAADSNTLMSVTGELQHNPDELRYGVMRALSPDRCKRKLAAKYAKGMVCLVPPGAENGGRPEHNVFSCRGDSGGPLVRRVSKKDELVGITSWSMGCGHNDFPSVYTDVTKYQSWIAAARQALKPGFAQAVPDPAAAANPTARRP